MPQRPLFDSTNDGHRLRLEIVDHSMSHAGDFRQLGISIAALDADYRSIGFLRYPENYGSELIDGDIRVIVDAWMWGDLTSLIRYIASQQRKINHYCRQRLIGQ